jgi:hypothetical protein
MRDDILKRLMRYHFTLHSILSLPLKHKSVIDASDTGTGKKHIHQQPYADS